MKKYILGLIFLIFICNSSFAAAEDVKSIDMMFDKRQAYDIYLSKGDDYDNTIVEDVQVVRFQEIVGRTFLVVKSKGFKISEEEGFILFDSIVAILPENNFRVRETQQTYKIKQ